MKNDLTQQLEAILGKVESLDEFAEIEQTIREARGRLSLPSMRGFWQDKTPCWEMFRCPEEMRAECPAYRHQDLPCWEIEGTYCKLFDYGAKGDGTAICHCCRVYKRWGNDRPIEIKLRGEGFNSVAAGTTRQ